MILSSLRHWLMAKRLKRPIRIVSTKEYLVVFVRVGLRLKGLYMRSCSVPVWESLLKFWMLRHHRQKMHLIVFHGDIQGLPVLKKQLYRRMQDLAISLGWMVVKSRSLVTQKDREDILLCLGIYKTVKR